MSRSPGIASGLAEIGKDPIVLDRGPFDRDLHPDPNLLGIAAGDIGVEARAGCAVEVDDDGDIDIILAGLRILDRKEHTSELQSLMRISYAVFCLKKKKKRTLIQLTKKTD